MKKALVLLFRGSALVIVVRVIGAYFVIGYLLDDRSDLQFSFVWALAYVAIVASVSTTMLALNLDRRFPTLGRTIFSSTNPQPNAARLTEQQWVAAKLDYMYKATRGGWLILLTPAEDGFVCAPLLVLGVTPITASAGGLLFGFLHLKNYDYFECLAKALYYGIACFVVLPHGFLSMIAGHFAVDCAGLAMLRYWRRRLKPTDAQGGQRGPSESEAAPRGER